MKTNLAQRIYRDITTVAEPERQRLALAVYEGALRALCSSYGPEALAEELYRLADDFACQAPRKWQGDDARNKGKGRDIGRLDDHRD